MKQILQNIATGETQLVDVPAPQCGKTELLIQTSCSLISVGTERMLVEFGKANMLSKARQQPEKMKMVLEKVRTDGLLTTMDAVKSKLDQSLPLGYCNVGTVIEAQSSSFKTGDRVVSNGPHAEVVAVPQNLCAKIPDHVSDETAAFTVLGAIALEGIRLAGPTLGESFVVTGLGLIGLLTVQLLRAHGCRVLGIDFDERKLELARAFGAETVSLGSGEDPVGAGMAFSKGRGVDGVIICASTRSSDPVSQAAHMCRKRGRIVLIGVTGLSLNRSDFYEKELSFQVSCSYGPGRYDPDYEQKGHDYPFGYVRWTEQRNFEAVLDMMADGRLNLAPLISHRFPLAEAVDAYKVLTDDRSVLGILLEYPGGDGEKIGGLEGEKTVQLNQLPITNNQSPVVGFIGAGNYATRILIPAFKETGAVLKSVASSGGVSGVHAGKKFGFQETTTDTSALITDPAINTVVITTRHNSHARLTCEALQAGKHVFVEKPLCMTLDELENIEEVMMVRGDEVKKASNGSSSTAHLPNLPSSPPLLMVGFNRRFAPQIKKIKELLAGVSGPKSFIMTVNAGAIPADHWTQDPQAGGGRLIGEACHFIDLLRFLSNNAIVESSVQRMDTATADTVSIQLGFADGSIGTVHYFANGSKSFAKERLEVFAAGRILQLDNFRTLRGYNWPKFKKMKLWSQDKGQKACAAAFVRAVQTGQAAPISFDEIIEVSRVTIELARGKNQL